jgi:DNA-binding NtrC family response regulator
VVSSSPFAPGHELLVIDDNATVRRAIAHACSHLGFTVLEASTRSEAFDCFGRMQTRPRIIVTDLSMPDGRGDDLAREFAAIDPGLRAVIVSGLPDDAARSCVDSDARFRLMSKPFTTEQLQDTITDALQSPIRDA